MITHYHRISFSPLHIYKEIKILFAENTDLIKLCIVVVKHYALLLYPGVWFFLAWVF